MNDDSGQLSLDFIIGFSIFLIGFIFVATLMSGLIIGLQSKTIDLDAVAYRTGVILVEDPGEPITWQLNNMEEKDSIIRLGLAISKDTPNILSREKVEKFNNSTFFSYPNDYRKRLIFSGEGTYPYYFQITLHNTLDNKSMVIGDTNSPQKFGYIKRAVFIKEPSHLNYSLNESISNFSVVFDFPSLYNDKTHGPVYWIDPLNEEMAVNINLPPAKNLTYYNLYYSSDGVVFQQLFGWDPLPIQQNGNKVTQVFPPGYFQELFNDPDNPNWNHLMITYFFDSGSINVTENYDYSFPLIQSNLTPATLEVKVW